MGSEMCIRDRYRRAVETLLRWLMNDFTQEWYVMRRARLALLLVAAVSGGVAWWATSTYYEAHYRERLEAAETRRELAQDELRRGR